jgi:hypothetical protein
MTLLFDVAKHKNATTLSNLLLNFLDEREILAILTFKLIPKL